MQTFLKQRSTLFIIALGVFVILGIHLIGSYIYSDGKYQGLPGGSISIGIVKAQSDAEHPTYVDPMNPLEYGASETANMLYNLLFRSLIRYNPATEIYEGDLANCDLSNLREVHCVLRDDAIWSDGSTLRSEDVIATFAAFKEQGLNKNIVALLQNVKVSSVGSGEIIIETPTSNPSMVELLSYPILRSDIVDQIKNNRIKRETYVTSGPFTYEETVDDAEFGFHRITLAKNPNYTKQSIWLDRLHFKIFSDVNKLERAIDTLTVILPPDEQQVIQTGPRFKAIPYNTYEFFGVSFQTDRLDKNIRNILHATLAKAFHENFPKEITHTPALSIFLNGQEITPVLGTGSMTLDTYMSDKGYHPKWYWLKLANDESVTVTGSVTYPKLRYFSNGGGNAVLYSDDPNASIRLSGDIPDTTTEVSVNDYVLREYSAGSTNYAYRVSIADGTIKEGKNEYQLKLLQSDGTTLTETLTIYQSANSATLENYRKSVESTYTDSENTPEKIAARQEKKDARIASVESLPEIGYYSEDLTPFSLVLAYVSNLGGSSDIANIYVTHIESALSALGIGVERMPLTAEAIENMISTGKKNYDLFLSGIGASGNIARLGYAFRSTEAGAGSNLSNIESKNLDTLFEKLRSTTDSTLVTAIESEITNFMNDQSIFLPISSPVHTLYIDRNIKGLLMIAVIPDTSAFSSILKNVSIKDTYIILWENKSISGFFGWIRAHF